MKSQKNSLNMIDPPSLCFTYIHYKYIIYRGLSDIYLRIYDAVLIKRPPSPSLSLSKYIPFIVCAYIYISPSPLFHPLSLSPYTIGEFIQLLDQPLTGIYFLRSWLGFFLARAFTNNWQGRLTDADDALTTAEGVGWVCVRWRPLFWGIFSIWQIYRFKFPAAKVTQ